MFNHYIHIRSFSMVTSQGLAVSAPDILLSSTLH
jgi:hypothetical protein